jgi:spore coat polysaccharide biosynthesis protein SpsF
MAVKTKQLSYWQGKFGDEYTKRNSDLAFFLRRKRFFTALLGKHPDIKTVLEIGSNIGGNLFVLNEINPLLKISAVEPNEKAAQKAQEINPHAHIFNKNAFDFVPKQQYDLVFTAGVLIHIANEDLKNTLAKIYECSQTYILTIEYYSPQTERVVYRGLIDALFKRPYKEAWFAFYPNLKLLKDGDLNIDQGFDNCHWWLFKK